MLRSDEEGFPQIGLQRPIGSMLEHTLLRLQGRADWLSSRMCLSALVVDIECSYAVKQAFFNTILILVYINSQMEGGDFSESDLGTFMGELR